MRGLGGVLEATHARPRLIVDAHPVAPRHDLFWVIGGRLVDWGGVADGAELHQRTAAALARAGRRGELGAHVPPDEVDEVRIVGSFLASHPQTRYVELDAPGLGERLDALAAELGLAGAAAASASGGD
jgi:hypothetical protein